MPLTVNSMAVPVIAPDQNTQTVADLAPGTLFRVRSSMSRRLFVKAATNRGTNGRKLKDRVDGDSIVAIIVPTPDRFDYRAWSPATKRLALSEPIVSTHGLLSVNA